MLRVGEIPEPYQIGFLYKVELKIEHIPLMDSNLSKNEEYLADCRHY